MLIEFSVENFRSFKERDTISLEAASITSEDRSVDENNVFPAIKNLSLLTSAVIYGANASGKSNLIKAFGFMRALILDSAKESQAEEQIEVDLYRLSTETTDKPAHFEILFLIEQQRYRYGFEVTRERVVREWLYFTPTIREVRLFERENDQIKPNMRYFREGARLQEQTRPNALYLSVTAQFNGKIAKKVVRWFRNLRITSGLNDRSYSFYTMDKILENESERELILSLVRSFDTGIEAVSIEKKNIEDMEGLSLFSEDFKKVFTDRINNLKEAKTKHTLFDENGEPSGQIDFDFDDDESEGTKKLFSLAGPVIDVLTYGRVMVIDEMEARLHPIITCAIVRLFNSRQTNPKRAQLLFTTHDTNLLDRSLFRRDQIWFVEKDSYGSSHLYSLVEFKPRNDESFERNYLRGKYGAIPYLGDLSQTIIASEQTLGEKSGDGA